MSENHHIHSSELDSRKNLMQYNCKIVPDLRSLKHTHTHENAKTASLKQKPTRKIWNKASKESWAILCCNKQVTGKPAKYMTEWTIAMRQWNSYTGNLIPV